MDKNINTIDDTDKMTVFFNKRLGIIESIIVGIHDMSVYGLLEEDMKFIIDFIIVPYDEYIYKNMTKFYVTENLEIKLYPIEQEKFNKYV